jgi:hypothetical protein
VLADIAKRDWLATIISSSASIRRLTACGYQAGCAQHPEEMTIVLQHQFWDLKVTSDAFEVGLSFGGVAERLSVPLDAIKGFAIHRCSSRCNSVTEEAPDERRDHRGQGGKEQ